MNTSLSTADAAKAYALVAGKRVIVMGGSRGIGRSIALDLARLGATVIGTATSESGAAAITAAFAEAGVTGRGAA